MEGKAEKAEIDNGELRSESHEGSPARKENVSTEQLVAKYLVKELTTNKKQNAFKKHLNEITTLVAACATLIGAITAFYSARDAKTAAEDAKAILVESRQAMHLTNENSRIISFKTNKGVFCKPIALDDYKLWSKYSACMSRGAADSPHQVKFVNMEESVREECLIQMTEIQCDGLETYLEKRQFSKVR